MSLRAGLGLDKFFFFYPLFNSSRLHSFFLPLPIIVMKWKCHSIITCTQESQGSFYNVWVEHLFGLNSYACEHMQHLSMSLSRPLKLFISFKIRLYEVLPPFVLLSLKCGVPSHSHQLWSRSSISQTCDYFLVLLSLHATCIIQACTKNECKWNNKHRLAWCVWQKNLHWHYYYTDNEIKLLCSFLASAACRSVVLPLSVNLFNIRLWERHKCKFSIQTD